MLYKVLKEEENIVLYPLNQNISLFLLKETVLDNVLIYVPVKTAINMQEIKIDLPAFILNLINQTVLILYLGTDVQKIIHTYIEKETDVIIYLSDKTFYVKETKTLVNPNANVYIGYTKTDFNQCFTDIDEESIRNFAFFQPQT